MLIHAWYEIIINNNSEEENQFNQILQDAHSADYFKQGNGRIYKKINNQVSHYIFSPGASFFFNNFLPTFNPTECQKPIGNEFFLLYGKE